MPLEPCWGALPAGEATHGKDGGGMGLGQLPSFSNCVLAEYVWLDAHGVGRAKTKTLTKRPTRPEDLPIWNFDGSSTMQSPGENSDVYLVPRAIFNDPFRGAPHVLVMAECVDFEMNPAIGNYRHLAAAMMEKYAVLDPWFGIEQEYTLMRPKEVGVVSDVPHGFNEDGSEPAAQGPYYCGAGTGVAIGREVVEMHYAACINAGVKIAGINAEVMPGQWEYQVGPCRGMEMGDHLSMSRFLMMRVTEKLGVQVSFHPKPREGDWNGAGCHTNFSVHPMRIDGGIDVINKVCEAFGKVPKEHIDMYGEDNEKRLTGAHETCSIHEFKFGVANRGCSIRIPRETAANKKGYMEDRRPAANCDPYKVTYIMMKTTGECLMP